MALSDFSCMRSTLWIYFHVQKNTHILCHLEASFLSKCKMTVLPFATCSHLQQHFTWDCKSPDILQISDDGIIQLPFTYNEFYLLLYLVVLLIYGD